MPQTLPKFVRLTDELYLGNVADLSTGWTIAGLEVKEVPPEGDPARDFVAQELRRGKLEPASAEEWDALQAHHEELLEIVQPDRAGEAGGSWNEPLIVRTMKDARRSLVALRNKDHQRRLTGGDGPEESQSEYASWGNQRLKEELKDRGLDTAGPKSELVARLEESDRQTTA